MESIEQMIKRLCPEGVKYVKLGEVCEIRRGIRVVKKQLGNSEGYPVYQNSLTSLGMYQSSNRKPGTTFVICAGAAGEIGYCNSEFWAADDCSTVESNVLTDRFIYFYLMTQQIKLKSQVRKASVPRLSRDAIENLLIPLPPMEIQARIVEILDKMTTLEAELEAELEARKQQYEYYRNKLLTFDKLSGGGIRFMKLGEVATIKNGKDHKPFNDGCIPVYGSGGIMRYIDTYVYDKPSVLLPRKGSLGNVMFTKKPFWTVDTMFWTMIDNLVVNEKFLFYYLKNYHIEKLSLTNGGAVPSLTQSQLKSISIPIPSMEEQSRIVSILDRFEALTTDLQSGLPAEIEARRQQYEHYRNKLLTFERR